MNRERHEALEARCKPVRERAQVRMDKLSGGRFGLAKLVAGNQAGDLWLTLQFGEGYAWSRFDLRTAIGALESEGAVEAVVEAAWQLRNQALTLSK